MESSLHMAAREGLVDVMRIIIDLRILSRCSPYSDGNNALHYGTHKNS
jgi:hypothetical protein